MRRIVLIAGTILMMLAPLNLFAATSDDKHATKNDTVFYSPTDGGSPSCNGTGDTGGGGGGGTLSGSDNIQKGFNYFVAKGFTPSQSAGIIGNFMQESGMDPATNQNGGGPGRGIAQWGVNDRWLGLLDLAKKDNKPPTDLGVQLDYVMVELNGLYKSTLTAVKAAPNVITATQVFENGYESAGKPQMQNRIAFAQEVLTKYGNSSSGGTGDNPSPTTSPAPGGDGDTTNCGGDTGGGTVDCKNATSNGQIKNLSAVRQNAVCIAQAELAKWNAHQLKPINGYLAYSQGRTEEWCADFVSWVYDQAKYPLQPDPNWNVPAVASVMSIGQDGGGGKWHWHAAGNYTPKPGDLVIHKENGSSHVNMVIFVASGTGGGMTLLGGDQGPPPYPGGSNVSTVDVAGFSGVNDITGYVTPD